MPRRRPVERRRCLKACDNCKKRKEKCDGVNPCSMCKKRKMEDSCTFLAPSVDRRISTSQQRPGRHLWQAATPSPTTNRESDHPGDLHSIPSPYVDHEEDSMEEPNGSVSLTSAPIPRLARLFEDGKGGRIYIGDSASLSFLRTIRRTVRASIGACSLTTDDMKHLLIEKTPDVNHEGGFPNAEPVLSDSEVLELARQFFLGTAGALDFFSPGPTMEYLDFWIKDPSRDDWPQSPVFCLLLAIGAQTRAANPVDDQIAQYYYKLGQQQAKSRLLNDPSILTVQSHCLITWYLITACRTNRATMELGVAVQAAFALGIHRCEVNALFGNGESILREKAWKSLRVCDLFLAASMGRPSLTSNIDRNLPPVSSKSPSENNDASLDDRMASGMTRICYVFERILSEVYPKRAISLELAASISKQHREWTLALPEMLKIDGLSQDEQHSAVDLTPFLGSAIVIMAYYYSIILLTRPFLTFKVNCHLNSNKDSSYEDTGSSPDVITFSDACVDSALKGIEMAQDVLRHDGMPNRSPLIVNSVFISALSLGLAYFGDYDSSGWALDSGLTQAVAVLRYFSINSPQAARYQQIIEYLCSATSQYKRQRDTSKSSSRSKLVRTVFGSAETQVDIQKPVSAQQTPLIDSHWPSTMSTTTALDNPVLLDQLNRLPFSQFDALLQSSMITTSGGLAPINLNDHSYLNVASEGPISTFWDGMPAILPQSMSFEDELPLFSIVSDFHGSGPNNWPTASTRVTEA